MEKTHFRKAFNSPYLSSADIVEPTILTISHVILEKDKTKKSKEFFNTAYFTAKEIRKGELLKPMILNATNSRTLRNLTGSPFLEDWQGVNITVYVDPNVRNRGEIVEGLRISPEPPRMTKPELQPNTQQWSNAVIAFKRDGNFSKIEARMTISDANKKAIQEQANEMA